MDTEIVAYFGVTGTAPQDIIDTLRCLVGETGKPGDKCTDENTPNAEYFLSSLLRRSGSSFFPGIIHASLVYDEITKDYEVSCHSMTRHYYSEFGRFLLWIAPNSTSRGFIGYMRTEDDFEPTLIYFEEGRVFLLKMAAKEPKKFELTADNLSYSATLWDK